MKLLPSTQDHLDILDIQDDVLILTGGRFRIVVEATAINFDLLSEDEQNATIFAYSNLVNSLNYPVQVLIRTRQVDVTNYINYLKGHLREQPTSALREQLQDYIDFIEQLVTENTVLAKRFFLVIPFWQGSSSGAKKESDEAKGGIGRLFGGKKPVTSAKKITKQSLEKAKKGLIQRFEELKWQFKRLGIQVKILDTEELIRLYYEIYNPEAGQNPGFRDDLYGYTTGIVDPLIKENYEEEGDEPSG